MPLLAGLETSAGSPTGGILEEFVTYLQTRVRDGCTYRITTGRLDLKLPPLPTGGNLEELVTVFANGSTGWPYLSYYWQAGLEASAGSPTGGILEEFVSVFANESN